MWQQPGWWHAIDLLKYSQANCPVIQTKGAVYFVSPLATFLPVGYKYNPCSNANGHGESSWSYSSLHLLWKW